MAQELTEATGPGFFKLNRAVSFTQLDPPPPPPAFTPVKWSITNLRQLKPL